MNEISGMSSLADDRTLISIVIPVFNCERYLSDAIESVVRQSYKPIEIIIVDDGSTDRSAAIAKSFGPLIKYVSQPHRGIAATRNRGISISRGSFFAFLDCDDIWTGNKLMLQMALFQANSDADIVFGHVQQFISPELDENQKKNLYCPTEEKMPGYVAGTMLIRRQSFVRAGPFETNLRIGEFVDWYIRAREMGIKSIMLPDVVLRRRLHADNTGSRDRDSRTDYVRILKASLDRRRASGQM